MQSFVIETIWWNMMDMIFLLANAMITWSLLLCYRLHPEMQTSQSLVDQYGHLTWTVTRFHDKSTSPGSLIHICLSSGLKMTSALPSCKIVLPSWRLNSAESSLGFANNATSNSQTHMQCWQVCDWWSCSVSHFVYGPWFFYESSVQREDCAGLCKSHMSLLGLPDLATDLVSESSDDPQLFRNPLISPFLRIRQTSTSCDDVRVYFTTIEPSHCCWTGSRWHARWRTALYWSTGMDMSSTWNESHTNMRWIARGTIDEAPPKTQLSGQVTLAATKSDKELSALTIRFETWIQVDMKNDQGVLFCWSRQTYANITCKHVTPLDFVAAGRGNTSHSCSKTKEPKKTIWKDRTDRVSSHWQAFKLSGKGFDSWCHFGPNFYIAVRNCSCLHFDL